MIKHAVLFVLALELLFLGSLGLDQEILMRTGESVVLRTTPVDPRDIFRGDYVILRYDVNAVGAAGLRDGLAGEPAADGERVYAVLEPIPGSDDLRRLAYVTDVRPDEGTFLAGRVGRPPGWVPRPVGGLAAHYGIEKLFVEQGRGWEIEERRGRRDGMQIPMEVELAVAADGDASIRDFRWSPMGVTLEVVRADERPPTDDGDGDGDEAARAPTVCVTLHNVGDVPRWVIDPGGASGSHCSFHLASADWGGDAMRTATSECRGITMDADALHRLAPGESYSVTLDLDAARWDVVDDDGVVDLATRLAGNGAAIRMVYRPDPAWLAGLDPSLGEAIWTTELYTPSFGLAGRID
ncbi:MAG: GDYXXLXY domain-containing protein [Acidobacteriota bacterium]